MLSNLVGRLVEAHALAAKACAVANENVKGAVELGAGVCASLLIERDDGAAHRALQRRVLAAAARYCDAALSSDDDATRVALAARAVDAALADCARPVACDVFSTLRAARSRAQAPTSDGAASALLWNEGVFVQLAVQSQSSSGVRKPNRVSEKETRIDRQSSPSWRNPALRPFSRQPASSLSRIPTSACSSSGSATRCCRPRTGSAYTSSLQPPRMFLPRIRIGG